MRTAPWLSGIISVLAACTGDPAGSQLQQSNLPAICEGLDPQDIPSPPDPLPAPPYDPPHPSCADFADSLGSNTYAERECAHQLLEDLQCASPHAGDYIEDCVCAGQSDPEVAARCRDLLYDVPTPTVLDVELASWTEEEDFFGQEAWNLYVKIWRFKECRYRIRIFDGGEQVGVGVGTFGPETRNECGNGFLWLRRGFDNPAVSIAPEPCLSKVFDGTCFDSFGNEEDLPELTVGPLTCQDAGPDGGSNPPADGGAPDAPPPPPIDAGAPDAPPPPPVDAGADGG